MIQKYLLLLSTLSGAAFAQSGPMSNPIVLSKYTLAAGAAHLPAASGFPHAFALITDGTSACDVSSGGGGTVDVLIQSDGTAWTASGCKGGNATPGGGLNSLQTYATSTTLQGNAGDTLDPSTGNLSVRGSVATTNGGGTSGKLSMGGATSGTGAIGVADIAGTPSTLLVPTGDGTSGQFLQSGTPSGGKNQMVWANGGGACITTTGQGNFAPFPVGLNQTTAYTANKVVMWEFIVPCQMTLNTLGAEVYTTDSGKHVTFAIYNATAGAIVTNAQCGTATAGGSNFNVVSCTFAGAVTLTPGNYFLAFSTDSAAVLTMVNASSSGIAANILNGLQTGASSRNFTCSNNSTGTTTITMPASCGTRTVLATGVDTVNPISAFLLP